MGYKKRPMRIGLKIGIKQQIYKLLSLLIKHLYRQRTAGGESNEAKSAKNKDNRSRKTVVLNV